MWPRANLGRAFCNNPTDRHPGAADNADARKYVSQAYGAPVPPPGEVAAFGAAGGASLYPSMNPSAMGARPDAR